jgi:nicotinate-nucleotide adenylyltransferase
MTKHTGIYPGTFDPVHKGHVAFALEAMRVCALDEVVFVPEKMPRGKNDVTVMAQRITLLEKAAKPIAGLRVATLSSSQFTIKDTLPELQKMFPSTELTLLVGSDVARTFSYRWENLDALLASVSLAIGMRAGAAPEEITALMHKLEHAYNMSIQYALINTEYAGLASSQLKNRRPPGGSLTDVAEA